MEVILPSEVSSLSSRMPATLCCTNCVMPCVDECARWAAPNASFT